MKLRLFFGVALAFALAAAPVIAFAVENPSKPGTAKTRGGGGKANTGARGAKPNIGGARIQQGSQMRVNRGTKNVQQGSFKRKSSVQNKALQVQGKSKATIVQQRKANRAVLKQQKLESQNSIYARKTDRSKLRSSEYREHVKALKLTNSQKLKMRKHARRYRHRLHRIARASFLLTVGSYVPQSYAIYDLPEEFYADVPEYEGYKYIVVGNELLIIDPETWEIIAIIPI